MPILGSRGAGAVKGFGLTSGGFGAPYDIDFLLIAGGGAGGNYISYNLVEEAEEQEVIELLMEQLQHQALLVEEALQKVYFLFEKEKF
jgi:hypothetical protein